LIDVSLSKKAAGKHVISHMHLIDLATYKSLFTMMAQYAKKQVALCGKTEKEKYISSPARGLLTDTGLPRKPTKSPGYL